MNVTALKTPPKPISLAFLLLAVGALTPASGSIVFQTTVDLSGTPGHTLEILSIQNDPTESGCVKWNGTTDTYGSPCPDGVGSITGGNETNLGSKTLTRRIGDVAGLATNGAADLAIIFNGNEPGSAADVVIQELVVMFYDPDGVLLYRAWMPSPYYVPSDAGGEGGAGFLFRLDYDQAVAAQLAAFSQPTFASNRIGLAATVSNTSGGAEVFYVSTHSGNGIHVVPEPVSYLTVGAGLFGIALLLRRRRNGRK